MRQFPFSFLEQPDAGGATAFPDQSLATWTSTEADAWLAYGASFATTSTFGYGTTTTRIGSDFGTGVAKWLGGSLANNGKIYTPPHVRSKWGIIDTTNDTVTESAATVNGSNQGSVYDKISQQVIAFGDNGTVIDISNDSATNISSGPPNRSCNPVQGFVGNDIYTTKFVVGSAGIEKYNVSTGVTSAVSPTGDTVTLQGENGTLGRDGCMYMPSVSSGGGIMKYNPATNVNTNLTVPGSEIFTTIVQHYNGYIYFLPQGTYTTLRWYDPSTSTWAGSYSWGSGFQTSNACIGLDGRIYCVTGQTQSTIKWYDPTAGTHGNITISNSDSSYQGITMGANGDLYLIPWTGSWFHKLALTSGTGTPATNVVSQYNFGGRMCWG